VEQEGVWIVKGGMRRVADALQKLGEQHGAGYRFNAQVDEIVIEAGRVAAVRLQGGERINCSAVVFNGDASALGAGLLGSAVVRAAPTVSVAKRSLSAVTWCMQAKTSGFNLHHHNVFFADHYPDEFDALFRRRSMVESPTVYVCAQDRADISTQDNDEAHSERLLLLINAPADGDQRQFSEQEISKHSENALSVMRRCGLTIEATSEPAVVTTPRGFNDLFPATGGALYGRANHGPMASFARPGAVSGIPGLFLAGGSVHPGPGVPMATLSGRMAAQAVMESRHRRARR
jgi:1-hydroxycarotenoid 3,4-desaturase